MTMIISDIILNWLHEDGYSLGESGWMNPLIGQQWIQVEATKDRHQHFVRGPDREQAIINLGLLVGYPLDE